MAIEKELYRLITGDEGWRSRAYDDRTGLEVKASAPGARLTIGYGFNIQDDGLPKEVADYWLEWRVNNVYLPAVKRVLPAFAGFTKSRRYALISMMYNLGEPRFKTFRKMISAICREDWEAAATECLDSDAARNDAVARYRRLAEMIRKG